MLIHPTIERLRALGLSAMADALPLAWHDQRTALGFA